MVSDKTIHKALRIEFIKIYKQNPLEIFSNYLPKLYFGFKKQNGTISTLCIHDR